MTETAWTTRRLLAWMTERFRGRGIDSPRVVAEMLLSHVLGCERLRLYMEVDRPASAAEREALRGLVSRALRHEPAQYLVGQAWFFGRAFEVGPDVLVPRPCTEMLVERAVEHLRGAGAAAPLVADVCTGSGCVAISVAAALPAARIIATDLSPAALAVARRNAERHGVHDRVELRQGRDLAPLAGEPGRLDALLANPPYVADHEWPGLPRNVREHEPEAALRGGPGGLDVIRPILCGAAELLRPGGLLAIEFGAGQAPALRSLAAAQPSLGGVAIHVDHESHDRALTAIKRGASSGP